MAASPSCTSNYVTGTPCTWMVDEEVLSVVELRGLSQGSSGPIYFNISALPSHGKLYQFTNDTDASGNPVAGALIEVEGTSLVDVGYTGSDEWYYKRVLYQGDLDFFNWPEQVRHVCVVPSPGAM